MLHDRRRWSLAQIETPAILTDHLTQLIWTPCQGFQIRGSPYLFLNDSTSPDGAQEYGVVLCEDEYLIQIESITFSWCQPFKARIYIDLVLAGKFNDADLARVDPHLIQSPEAHGTCRHCL